MSFGNVLHQVYANGQRSNPTVFPRTTFSSEEAANAMKQAMKGLGTNEGAIVTLLGGISSDQRLEMKEKFKALFGQDLIEELKSELSGDLLKLCICLLMRWDEMIATSLHEAMAGAGTNESVLIDTLCTLSGPEIEMVKSTYAELLLAEGKSGRTLEKDIVSELSGDLEQLIVAILQAQREELALADIEAYVGGSKSLKQLIDMEQVHTDAKELYAAGEGKFGTDESTFISKFANRNKFHLFAMSEVYEQEHGKTLLEAVDKEFSGRTKTALELLFNAQLEPKTAYVTLLQKYMDGVGTSEGKLMRLIVSRSEVDLADIKGKFEEVTGKSLPDRIRSETSGDFQALLLSICGETA